MEDFDTWLAALPASQSSLNRLLTTSHISLKLLITDGTRITYWKFVFGIRTPDNIQ